MLLSIFVVLQLAVNQCRAIPVVTKSLENTCNDIEQIGLNVNHRSSPMLQLEHTASTSSSATSVERRKKKVAFARDFEVDGMPLPVMHTTPTGPSLKAPAEPLPKLPRRIATRIKHDILAAAHEARAAKELQSGIDDSARSIKIGKEQGKYHLNRSLEQLKMGNARKGIKEVGKALAKTSAGVAFSPVPLMGGLAGSVRSRGKALKHSFQRIRAPVHYESRLADENVRAKAFEIENPTEKSITDEFIERYLKPQKNKRVLNLDVKTLKLLTDIENAHRDGSHAADVAEVPPFDSQARARIEDWMSAASSFDTESSSYHSAPSSGPRLTRSSNIRSSPRFDSKYSFDSQAASSSTSLVEGLDSPTLSTDSKSPEFSDDSKYITIELDKGHEVLPHDKVQLSQLPWLYMGRSQSSLSDIPESEEEVE